MDNHIQLLYNGVFAEKHIANASCRREIPNSSLVYESFTQLLKTVLPFSTRFFGRVDACVTYSPLATEIEIRAIKDVLRKSKIKYINLIPFPIATFEGLSIRRTTNYH